MATSWMVCGSRFDVDSKYELIKPIGVGAYGVVCAAKNRVTDERVAIKKIGKAFDHIVDAKRTLREIKLLRNFNHENVIAIKDIQKPPSFADFEDVYIVTDLMDTDLHQIISSPQRLTDDHCQYFLYQILRGLKYIHSARVMHRDLKPSNLLLNSNCDLKICDFGLARIASPHDSPDNFMTEYVATRWYRAPEIMLCWKEYTQAIDMWSVGCIFAELLGRKALFPGRDYISQLTLIIDVCGTPSADDIKDIGSDRARKFLESLPYKPKVPFRNLYPNATPQALDLLDRMLAFDPAKRITVDQALQHPYLQALHDPNDEPVCMSQIDFDFENQALSRDILKRLIFEEMAQYNPGALLAEQNDPRGYYVRQSYVNDRISPDEPAGPMLS